MYTEVSMYVLRKGKEVVTADTSIDKVKNLQFFRGGEISKEKVTVKIPAQKRYD